MRYRLDADGVSLGIEDGCIVLPGAPFDFTVSIETGELRPGLINAHDHLHRNHYPRLGTPPYEDAYEWGRDLHANFTAGIERARALPRRDALLFGALKNLLGGVTSVVHHDAWEPDFARDFPVNVVPVRCVHSIGFDAAGVRAASADRAAGSAAALAIHLAEGVNAAAAEEVRTIGRVGLLDESLLAVHLVGADADAIERLHTANAATVWCPTSNLFLFGRTAPPALLRSGDVLLGTDALLTGAGTLLDELRAARALGCIPDTRLAGAVGAVAARRLGLEPRLAPGGRADVVVLKRPLLEAFAHDVALVIVGGVPRLGDPEFAPLFEFAGVQTGRIVVNGSLKLVCRPLDTVAERVTSEWPECGRILLEPTGMVR